ncbi:MAG: [FeFe] hydrogenase H-cluster maturation GTPase HydF [Spirochaetes bacterium]|nr:[FeFe] hydrogenase H-cluster maturation GTPase HydF [Spirochaetota bacterium]
MREKLSPTLDRRMDEIEGGVCSTPLALSLHIVLVGIRNAGKSSLLNTLFEKEIAIVSPHPGTTTDPVLRKMELKPLGPVALVDTAGIDDEGDLGNARVKKTLLRLEGASIVLFVTPSQKPPKKEEREMLRTLKGSDKPYLVVLTFCDQEAHPEKLLWLEEEGIRNPLRVDNTTGRGGKEVREALSQLSEVIVPEPTPLEGLVEAGDTVLLVVPIDSAAPKGRLILPQVETIRDALDRGCTVVIAKERELREAYGNLRDRPRVVITDSQAFQKVASMLPKEQPLTSFSILFARKKGELEPYLASLSILGRLPSNSRVLILEACSHHRQPDDIGTVKIPRLLRERVHPNITVDHARSPEGIDLTRYNLIIHCAACMLTRRAMVARLSHFHRLRLPVMNYGLFLAWANGLLPRVLEPLPEYESKYVRYTTSS